MMVSMDNGIGRLCPVAAVLMGVLLLSGCPATNPPQTVAYVDIERYMGLWYEIAKFPVFFERGLVGVTAEYALEQDGRVRVKNRGFKGGFDGEPSLIEGYATVMDPGINAKLKIRFDPFPTCLFPADYWIIDLGQDYAYAVVSSPSRKVLWILSRTPVLDDAVYAGIVAGLAARGFDTEQLEMMPQQATVAGR